jgi:hypothetical protein
VTRWIRAPSGLLLIGTVILIYSLIQGRDPLDTFEVIAVESNKAGLHATTYKYYHSNSSNSLFAVWIIAKTTTVGSTLPPPGSGTPVMAWTNSENVLSMNWVGERLQVIVAENVLLDHDFGKCFFNYDMWADKERLCIDQKQNAIDLVHR